MKKQIYSIGSSTRGAEAFLSVLKFYSIEALIDVRRFPKSSRFNHFQMEELASILSRSSIKYHYLGAELGGYRKGGYEEYMGTAEFAAGLARLEEIASAAKAAFMCAERLPWKCHRRFVADALRAKGWDVRHIIDVGKIWAPKKLAENRPGPQALPLFAYGSLCDADLVKRLLKKEVDFEEASIEDYTIAIAPGFRYPFLVERAGSVVAGKIIRSLNEKDYATLDDYEGTDSRLYRRISRPVKLKGGSTIEANLYVGGNKLLQLP